ncbi:MAG: hypothetical protein AB7E47_06010 [Desulfovibrionaceae bacterium]
MSVFEWTSAMLGMLGFALGVLNLVWMVRRQSPNLSVDVPVARMFKAHLERRCAVPELFERDVVVLDVLVAVSNVSQVGNTVVSVESGMRYNLVAFGEEDVLIVGERTIDVSKIYGDDRILKGPIVFQPRDAIGGKVPARLAPGDRIEGALTGEIKQGDSPLGESFDLDVLVRDAHGKTYKKTVRVNREEPIDLSTFPLDEGVCPCIKACSI